MSRYKWEKRTIKRKYHISDVFEKERNREGQERLKIIAEKTNDGIWEFDVKTTKSYWNDQMYTLLGYEREQTENQGYGFLLTILHPDDRARVQDAFLKTCNEGVPYDVEYRIRHSDGHFLYVHSKATPVYNEKGEIIKVAGSIEDITKRKEMGEALKKSESLFSSIFNQTSVGIFQFELNGKFKLVNDQFCKILGRSKDELYRINLFDLIFKDDVLKCKAMVNKIIIDGKSFKLEKRYLKNDGSIVWLNTDVSSVKNEEGDTLCLLAVCQDITERKQAEAALQESEQRFRTMAEASGLLISHTDKNGKTIYYNNEWQKFTGMSFHELLNIGWTDLFHPDDREETMSLFRKCFENKEGVNREFRLWSQHTGYRWLLTVASPLFDFNGTFAGYVSSSVDITERKKAEEALIEKEFRFRTLIEEATVATALYVGKDLIIQYANQLMLQYWNKDHSVIGRSVEDVIAEFENQQFLNLIREVYKTGIPYYGKEERVDVWGDGQLKTFYFNFTLKALRDQQGEIYGIHNMSIDVTDQVIAKNYLKESEERFRMMADASRIIIWALNPDISVKYVNKFALNFLGISLEKFIKDNWIHYIHPDDVNLVKSIILQAIKDKNVFSVEHRFLRSDGQYRWLLTQGGPSYYPNGDLYGYVGSAIDITDRMQTEKLLEVKNNQLTRTNNDLDNFIYTASHDLKAPIINIEGLVGALESTFKEDCKKNDEVNVLIGMIQQSVDRFKETIKDLTEVAKVQNSGEEELTEVSIHDMLEEVKLNIKSLIDNSNAVIYSDFYKAPFIYFSKKNLRSIIYNLLSNAIKYKSPDRPVVIKVASSKPDSEHILLTVEDNGLGIKEADKGKVFTMFKRLHQHVEGTGVGLSIVKKIIDNNGGTIDIESEPGRGTIFKIYLKVN
jgi:PAS domain S-box-containing protein